MTGALLEFQMDQIRRVLVFFLLALAAGTALAQQVQLGGVMGSKALLMIDGQSQIVAVGETARGVRLVAVDGDTARVQRDGQTVTLKVGSTPLLVGRGGVAQGRAREVVIPAGQGGHFIVEGAINGSNVRFMVDTGATVVSMSVADASRIGLNLRGARQGVAGTANGLVRTVSVMLDTVRVGDVEVHDVEALISPEPMPFVLLGNSVLGRFQMRRDNDVMRLVLRAN